MKNLKIGDLARLTELSVRTLHHYDEIGLLAPSDHSEAGHRLYSREDLEKLQKIMSLKQLGLTLDEIKTTLEGPGLSLLDVILRHIVSLKTEIQQQENVLRRLSATAEAIKKKQKIEIEELVENIKEMVMFEKYYPKEQLEELKEREQKLGAEKIAEVQNEWPILISKVKEEMEKGTDPGDPTVQELAKKWAELISLFTGGNQQIGKSLSNMYKSEPKYAQQMGLDKNIFEFIQKAQIVKK